ncbi:MAG: HDIG domain-containing protein [Actinomycetota bacterium]|nr:HDIG domain-containing protein [Actinomycetota bacterium]MDD5665824.1 HDIG domain-containing protein [Actinomycetota bacterium]
MEDKEGPKGHHPWYRSIIPRSGEKRALLISLALLVLILALLVLEYAPRVARFEVGKPSTETVISSRDFSVVDEEATREAREAERARKERLFVDDSANREALSRLGLFFDRARETSVLEGDLTDKINALLAEEAPDMSLKSMKTILQASEEDSPIIFATAVDLLTTAMSRPVSSDNLKEKKDEIKLRAEAMPLAEDIRQASMELAASFLATNTAYSSELIERDIEDAMNNVEAVAANYSAGQKIVEKGEIISELTLASLSEAGALSPVGNYQQVLGISVMVIVLYAMALVFFKRFRPDIAGNWRVVAMICLVFLAFCVSCRVCAVFIDENPLWGYLIPLALVGLILAVLLDDLVALFMVVSGGILTGLFVKGNIYLTFSALLGGIAAALLVTEIRKREDLIRAAVEISLILAVISMITASLIKDMRFILLAGLLGLGNGAVTAVLTLGLLPVLERISGITTPMHLLELASPDQPLMRELVSKAPGTYSHSVIMGNLANAAALEIGADAQLARVGSYYHDIGKIKRSSFFVENQPSGSNGHVNLKPNLSALVITAHVKEGVELAREYHLPQEVVDIIRQHHGTSLVRYFYARALEEGGGADAVSESRFRYPGEKPQSKEAALVMLADAVEAAAKALEKPTPVKLEQLVKSLVEERLEDGQLSESNMTMGDLEKMSKAFVRVLSGMYHERIEYPVLVKEEGVS